MRTVAPKQMPTLQSRSADSANRAHRPATPQGEEPSILCAHDFGRIPLHAGSTTGPETRSALQRAPLVGGSVWEIPPIVSDVLRSPGHPLDAQTRTFFEPRLGHDFGHVRIHTDAQANASARAVQAHAYTVGRDVVFGGGRFSPRSRKGQRLLAHELTHVVQQTRRTSDSVSAARAVQEQEAERVSQDVMRGTHAPAQAPSASPIRVARQPVEAHEATDEDRRFVVDAAAQWLVGMAEQVQALRRAAAAALRTTPGSAAGPRAFHGYLNQDVLQRLMGKAISVFEAQRSDNPYINFPAESPEQTRLGEAYARALEQFGLAINEARANGANLAPTLRDAEESRYAANHLRWMEANPSAPLAAGMRTTFTRAEVDISTRRHSLVSTEFANLAANVHVYNLAGNGAQRLRQALADSAYRLMRDPTTSAVRAQPDTTLQATIQPVLDQLAAIDWAIAQAVDRLQRAETRTRAFAADPAANRADGNTLHAHFSTRHPGYATLLADRFARMQRELRGQGALTIHARNPSDPDCGVGSVGGGISVIAAHADANRFHFCGNVTIGDDEIVSTVIHETVHAVIPSLGARAALTPASETPRDRSYAGERVYSRLTTEEALDNAESYAFYVDALFGVTVHRPTPPGDTVTGCSDPDTVRAALARATYRIRLAAQWASQYRASAPPPFVVTTMGVGFPGADAARAGAILMHLQNLSSTLEYYLPVVCRSATDSEARAGGLVYGPANRATSSGLVATSRTYPGGTLRICPAWFNASTELREDTVTAILVLRYRSAVPVADVAGMVALARHIQEEVHPSVASRTLAQHQAADAALVPTP